jgi:L-alanine-DL-glutamate epimerase-like enolase superfamily enzyme
LIISNIEVRMCQNPRAAMSDAEMRAGGKSTFDFLVVTMQTDSGLEGRSMGFAGRGAEMAGVIAATVLKPFFLGRDPLFREQH